MLFVTDMLFGIEVLLSRPTLGYDLVDFAGAFRRVLTSLHGRAFKDIETCCMS